MKILKIFINTVFMFFVLSVSSSNAEEASLSLTISPLSTSNDYFTVRPDYRKCASPVCGGWFVSAVNLKKMRCPDKSFKSECYVGADVINIPGLTLEQLSELNQAMSQSNVLIKGAISSSVPYGLLIIDSAWLSATDVKPEGVFVGVSDNGVRCITYPCLSYDGVILNKNHIKSLASYDLSGVKATAEQLDQAFKAVVSAEGLPMAGKFVDVTGPAGVAQGIKASQFYLKLEGIEPKLCRPTGCSSQICSDTDVITTCEWRPEYACYRSATCRAQENGDCGWVMDAELLKCLEEAAVPVLLQ